MDEGVVTTPAGYGAAGEMTYKCTECDATKTEPIAALDAKDCSVAFESGYNPSRVYNGTQIAIGKAKIIRKNANGETIVTPEDDIVLEFKVNGADDSTYSTNAPKDSGTYTVRAIVKGSAEWKECSTATALDFTISKVKLTGTVTHPTSQTYTASVQDFPNLKITSADLSCIVAGDTLDLANIKSTVADAGTNKATFSFAETNNYYMQNDGSLTVDVTISPKPIILSGEYCFWAVDGAELKINFIIPSGLSDNAVLKMNLNRSGKTWELGKEYTINSSEYPVSWYEPAPNYVPMLADGGIKVAIKKGNGPTLTVGTEHSYTTDADGCIIAFFGTLGNLKRYRIEIKTAAGVSVPYNKMTMIGKQTTSYPLTMNIQNINSNGEFVFYGISNQTSTLYVKGEPNSTYKVKITEIT